MPTPTHLLGAIVLSYLFPIGTVGYHYASDQNPTISSVICKEECQDSILWGMLAMAALTVVYEISRGRESVKARGLPVLLLLVGVIGVILFQESLTTHTVFSTLVFTSMIAFMAVHLWTHPTDRFLPLFAAGHLVITIAFAYCYATGQHAFGWEAAILASFAVFYLYTHTLSHDPPVPHELQESQELQDPQGA